jgi:hypothetical protein
MASSLQPYRFVLPGLVPGIHDLFRWCSKDVDGRAKPGHDDAGGSNSR